MIVNDIALDAPTERSDMLHNAGTRSILHRRFYKFETIWNLIKRFFDKFYIQFLILNIADYKCDVHLKMRITKYM